MKEYKIKEKLYIFRTLKRIETGLLLIGLLMVDDKQRCNKIGKAREILIGIVKEIEEELEELRKKGVIKNGKKNNNNNLLSN